MWRKSNEEFQQHNAELQGKLQQKVCIAFTCKVFLNKVQWSFAVFWLMWSVLSATLIDCITICIIIIVHRVICLTSFFCDADNRGGSYRGRFDWTAGKTWIHRTSYPTSTLLNFLIYYNMVLSSVFCHFCAYMLWCVFRLHLEFIFLIGCCFFEFFNIQFLICELCSQLQNGKDLPSENSLLQVDKLVMEKTELQTKLQQVSRSFGSLSFGFERLWGQKFQ